MSVQPKFGGSLTAQRSSPATDPSKEFQALIDGVGASNILEDFASFLGRDNMGFCQGSGKTRSVAVPAKFSGLAFDGAHWKGYEDGAVKWDSYSAEVQLPKTNNYCQSYACFMWASGGLENKRHKVALLPKQYSKNVMTMSALWLAYFKWRGGDADGTKWLDVACPGWAGLKLTLGKLSADEKLAKNFSTSAE